MQDWENASDQVYHLIRWENGVRFLDQSQSAANTITELLWTTSDKLFPSESRTSWKVSGFWFVLPYDWMQDKHNALSRTPLDVIFFVWSMVLNWISCSLLRPIETTHGVSSRCSPLSPILVAYPWKVSYFQIWLTRFGQGRKHTRINLAMYSRFR